MVRVGVIGEDYGATGKGLYAVELANALFNLNQDVKLFVRGTVNLDKVFVIKVPTPWTPRIRILAGLSYYIPLTFFIRKNIKKYKLDILHAYDEKTGAFCLTAEKPLVVTVHDIYPLSYKFPFNFLFNKIFMLLKKSDAIIVVSKHVASQLLSKFPFLKNKIFVVYNGVRLDKFFPPKKRGENISIGVLGNLDFELINIFWKIRKKYGEFVRIYIAGRGTDKFSYLRNTKGFIFKGFLPESKVPAYYRSLDIFVYKTIKEGFGLIPLEAMASGCAVVCSNVASLPEVVGNGGILVNNKKEEFYKALVTLIENERLRYKLQKRARRRAENFSWKKTAKETTKVYEYIINRF